MHTLRRTPFRRVAALVSALTVTALLAACSGGSGAQKIDEKAPSHLSGTVSLWHFFTDREAKVIQKAVDGFEKKYPDVTVQVHSGQDDEKLQKAISAGSNVDVGISYSTDIVGAFCSSGAFRDLGPYIARDHVDLSQFSATVRSYTEYKKTRCTLPLLEDVYGLYYNRAMLKAAGYSEPPTTLDQLEDIANKTTTFNADGSIKTLGFNPLFGYYENAAAHYGPSAGAKWLNADGTSAVGSSEGWKTLMKWQKGYVDKLGYDKLKTFTASAGQEFSASNDFQKGRVAMNLDGEYRTAFIDDQAPDLDYGTAPFPVASGHDDLYGGGYVTGNIAGIAKGSKNPELAWALLKYLTTDTDAVVGLANGLKNVPSTAAALKSPDLQVTDQFRTFLDIASDANAQTTPASPSGAGYQNAFGDYWTKWQEGKGGDLDVGLKKVDKQIDDELSLVSGP